MRVSVERERERETGGGEQAKRFTVIFGLLYYFYQEVVRVATVKPTWVDMPSLFWDLRAVESPRTALKWLSTARL